MLIEQTIEFELEALSSWSYMYPKIGIFMAKHKNLLGKSWRKLLFSLLLKILLETMYLDCLPHLDLVTYQI